MKSLLVFFTLFASFVTIQAQDTLFMKNGDTIIGSIQHSSLRNVYINLDADTTGSTYTIKSHLVDSTQREATSAIELPRATPDYLQQTQLKWRNMSFGVRHLDRDLDLLYIEPSYGFQFEYYGGFQHLGSFATLDFGGPYINAFAYDEQNGSTNNHVRKKAAPLAIFTLGQNFYLTSKYSIIRPYIGLGAGIGLWDVKTTYFGYDGSFFPGDPSIFSNEENRRHLWSHLSTNLGFKVKATKALSVSLGCNVSFVQGKFEDSSYEYNEDSQTWSNSGQTYNLKNLIYDLYIPLGVSFVL